MCGIAGATGKDSQALVDRMLDALKHRGPDGAGTHTIGDITLGSVVLKLTGNVKQPISNIGALTYNGEIYNFHEIAREINFKSDSDSETLFNLIETKSLESAIKKIDGDYAFASASEDKLRLVRDPVGVKPLYYAISVNRFAFASEKKALQTIGMEDIFTLKPGHLLTYSGSSITMEKVSGFRKGEKITDERRAAIAILEAIKRAAEKRMYKPCAIAFSGGIDSALLAALCPQAQLYSVGMAGSHDILQTRYAAGLLGISDNLHLHELTPDEVESAIPEVIKALGSSDPLAVSIALPLYIVSRNAHHDGIRVIMSGQGADELFAGYRRYESMNREELDYALWNDIQDIAVNNLERDDAVTMANSVELRVPFLDMEIVELALGIAPELKVHNGIRKYILRMAASGILPPELAMKDKKAAQYSSGIYSALRKLAKKNGFKGERFVARYLRKIGEGII
ncbi:MAG: asparagine synthetase B family protein [Candidatus Methanoperedens sp.]